MVALSDPSTPARPTITVCVCVCVSFRAIFQLAVCHVLGEMCGLHCTQTKGEEKKTFPWVDESVFKVVSSVVCGGGSDEFNPPPSHTQQRVITHPSVHYRAAAC